MGDRKVYTTLHIYDYSDWVGRRQYERGSHDTISIRIDEGKQQLKRELDKLLKEGKIFQKAVFTTHGNSGAIWLAADMVSPVTWYQDFHSHQYERLFPFRNARMYFDGCNVAAGDDGWKFLEAAARTFFRYAGGNVFGWTSAGFGLPSVIPWIGGHTEHLWGDVRGVVLTPGDDGGAYLLRWGS